MLPEVIESLIFDYVDAIAEGCSLPSFASIRKLVKRSDVFVMNTLGFVMGMPTTELIRLRYRIVLKNDFLFYFRLSPMQRLRFVRSLKRGILTNQPTACLIWVYLVSGMQLYKYKKYRFLFENSLLVKFLGKFSVRGSILDRIV